MRPYELASSCLRSRPGFAFHSFIHHPTWVFLEFPPVFQEGHIFYANDDTPLYCVDSPVRGLTLLENNRIWFRVPLGTQHWFCHRMGIGKQREKLYEHYELASSRLRSRPSFAFHSSTIQYGFSLNFRQSSRRDTCSRASSCFSSSLYLS